MCKHVGPHMAAQKSGRIINIGPGTSLEGHPGMLHYVSSKGAITAPDARPGTRRAQRLREHAVTRVHPLGHAG